MLMHDYRYQAHVTSYLLFFKGLCRLYSREPSISIKNV